MAEGSGEGLGEQKQQVNLSPQTTPTEESLAFLESFIPMTFNREGAVVRGNIPQRTLIEHWDLLHPHHSLANLEREDVGTMTLMVKRNILNKIATTPANRFTLAVIRELDRVKMGAYLLDSKSTSDNRSSPRDRVLIPAVVSLTETRSQYREEGMQPQKKRSIFNPLSWFG